MQIGIPPKVSYPKYLIEAEVQYFRFPKDYCGSKSMLLIA